MVMQNGNSNGNGNGEQKKSANGVFEATILGNLGRDPELRYTPTGTAVCNISVAVNLPTDQNSVDTLWVRITIWGKQAETVNQYLKKGRKALIFCDRIRFDPATGGPVLFKRQAGDVGASFELTARRVVFVDANRGDDLVVENGVGENRIETRVGEGAVEEQIQF